MTSILLLASIPFSFGLILWAAGAVYQRVRRRQFIKYASHPKLTLIKGGQ